MQDSIRKRADDLYIKAVEETDLQTVTALTELSIWLGRLADALDISEDQRATVAACLEEVGNAENRLREIKDHAK